MISEAYVDSLRKEGHAPVSLHRFCEALGISEKDF